MMSNEEQLLETRLELENLTKAVNVINHLAVSLDINAAMESVRDGALELLDCERVTLFLVFERRKELRARVDQECEGSYVIKVGFDEGIAGAVVRSGKLMNIPDVYLHPLFNAQVDRRTGFVTKSMLCCAIRDTYGKTVAVLQALNKSSNQTFSSTDERNLNLFGTHLGNTLAKAKLHEQAQREKDRLSSLFNFFKLLSTASDLQRVLTVVSDSMHEVLHAEHAFVFIMDAPRGELWMQCSVPDQEEFLSVRVPVGDGLVGQCGLDHSMPINITDYAGDDELISVILDAVLQGDTVHSVLAQPVFGTDNGGKVAAVILAINKREVGSESDIFFENYFTESDVDAMALFALELADALTARSLEVAYASALSVINSEGMAPARSRRATVSCSSTPTTESMSQLMNMYFKGVEDHYPVTNEHVSAARPSTGGSRSLHHWQSALNKLSAARIIADSHRSRNADDHRRSEPTVLPQLKRLNSAKKLGSREGTNEQQSLGKHHSHVERSSMGWSNASPPSFKEILQQDLGADSRDVRPHSFSAHGLVQPPVSWLGSCPGAPEQARPHSFTSPHAATALDVGLRSWEVPSRGIALSSEYDGQELLPFEDVLLAEVADVGSSSDVLDGNAYRGLSPPRIFNGSNNAVQVPESAQQLELAVDGVATNLEGVRNHNKMARGGAPSGPMGTATVSEQSGVTHANGSLRLTSCPPGRGDVGAVIGGSLAVMVPRMAWHRSDNCPLAPPVQGESDSPSVCFIGRQVLSSFDYDFTRASTSHLNKMCYDMFILSGVVEHFQLNITTLGNWLTAVASHYHDVPYHNYTHACHVLHGTWMALQTPTAKAILSMEDHLGLMVAALCHDLDHDGRSNNLHIHTQSALARLYNDSSVMENHHCALTFEVLRRKDCALLDHLEPEVRRRLRKLIIGAILCTDMSNHFTVTQEFKRHNTEFDPEVDADRQLLGKVLLHSADIGASVRPFHINSMLSRCVHTEFQAQAEEERSLGLPVTFSIDSNDSLMCAQVELNFLDYIVRPLWERLAEVLPELQPAFETIIENRECYARIVAKGKQQEEQQQQEEEQQEQQQQEQNGVLEVAITVQAKAEEAA